MGLSTCHTRDRSRFAARGAQYRISYLRAKAANLRDMAIDARRCGGWRPGLQGVKALVRPTALKTQNRPAAPG
jgi:hypothetical protein